MLIFMLIFCLFNIYNDIYNDFIIGKTKHLYIKYFLIH